MKWKISADVLIVTAVLVFPSFAAHSESYFQSGNTIYQQCTSSNYQDSSFCIAYIAGVADTMEMNRAFLKKGICIPDGSTQGQLKDVIVKYLRDNPEHRNIGASILVTFAFTKAFGCS